MSHWSKLKRDLENLMSPDIDFNIYCNSYRIGEATPIPRFWVTIDKHIVWDWPRDFKSEDGWYFYEAAKRISQLIREYINTPRTEIFTTEFDDRFHLVPLLQICDSRVGKRTLTKLLDHSAYHTYNTIILRRLKNQQFLIHIDTCVQTFCT